jgi:hypothetical protein
MCARFERWLCGHDNIGLKGVKTDGLFYVRIPNEIRQTIKSRSTGDDSPIEFTIITRDDFSPSYVFTCWLNKLSCLLSVDATPEYVTREVVNTELITRLKY